MTNVEIDIEKYFAREAIPRACGIGQLKQEFQAALALYHSKVTEDDCEFYHTVEFPDGRVRPGAWDLRKHEHKYLGNLDLGGKNIIEYGPASGWLSHFMVNKGANLTVFDLPIGKGPDIMPFSGFDLGDTGDGSESMTKLRNSWWYLKRLYDYRARAVYGDIYNQPTDLGRYEISVFGAILVHLSSPFRALQQAAAITTETMIVTDVIAIPPIPQLPGLMQFGPTEAPQGLVHWWNYSASALQLMMHRLGFTRQTVTLHSPQKMASKPPMITVVGHRN